MANAWQLQEAKNRLSHLVEQAKTDGPQTITVRGTPTVVILSVEEYERLSRKPQKLSAFFEQSPLKGVELDLERSRELSRQVEL